MPNDPSAARHPLKRGVLDDHQIVNRLLLKQAAGTGEDRFAPADQTVPPREVAGAVGTNLKWTSVGRSIRRSKAIHGVSQSVAGVGSTMTTAFGAVVCRSQSIIASGTAVKCGVIGICFACATWKAISVRGGEA